MLVRLATLNDLDEIAEVHLAAFPGFFLTMLGKRFLIELYTAFLSRSTGLLIVAYDETGTVVGFAAGTSSPHHFYKQLRKEKWSSFLIKALPALIKNPKLVVKKLYHALFYRGDSPTGDLDAALLSSIAVAPDRVGMSLGKTLLKEFERKVKALGAPAVYLTTDKQQNESVIQFYQRSGYAVEAEFTQSGGREMLRLMKIFPLESPND